MLFHSTQRHYAICSLRDLPAIGRRDPGFWNVISVLENSAPQVPTQGFLKNIRVACDDVTEFVPGVEVPGSKQIDEVFRFADSVIGEPLLIHCMFGESRSPAIALLLMMRDMQMDGYAAEECANASRRFLLSIRPQAKPNPLILETGLRMLFNEA